MRCIALGALHAAGHVGERGRCIVRFDKAGALDGIFPVAGADGVDRHIQAGELLVLLHVKQVVLLVVFLRRLAGRDAEQPDWTVIPELVEELTGTGVQLLRDVGGGSKRYLSGSVAEIIVHNLHLHHADIGAGSADSGTDRLTEREKHMLCHRGIRHIVLEREGIAESLACGVVVGQRCGFDSVGIIPDGVAVGFKDGENHGVIAFGQLADGCDAEGAEP